MPKTLWLKLVLPLTLLSALSLLLHQLWDAGGFFINLTTELLGIIVTVVYVDWVLRSHEKGRWAGTGSRLQERLAAHGALTISAIRRSLGFGPDILDDSKLASSDVNDGRREMARVAEHVLKPAARNRLDKLNQEGWQKLAESLRGIWDGSERLIDRFGYRLEPSQLEVLMDMQQSVRSGLFLWETFPELAGVPDDQLPETKTPAPLLKQHGYDATAKDIRALLDQACKLLTPLGG